MRSSAEQLLHDPLEQRHVAVDAHLQEEVAIGVPRPSMPPALLRVLEAQQRRPRAAG